MLNRVVVSGYLTGDIELRQTTSGISVCSFSIGVRRNYKNAGGEFATDFIDCTAFRNTAEYICRYFGKGQQIIVDGSLTTDYYEKNNVQHKAVKILVDSAYSCASKKDEKKENENKEELPF